MKFFVKPTKYQVIPSLFVLLWIFIAVVGAPFITAAQTWPMFFVTIFFFVQGMDIKKIPSIFLGGAFGIVTAFGIVKLLGIFAPMVGLATAQAIIVFVALALIIVGGNICPTVLNNIAFAYLTICTINVQIIAENTVNWLLMLVVGGGILLTVALLILKGVTSVMTKNLNDQKQEA